MKNLLSPKWIFLVNTFPTILLILPNIIFFIEKWNITYSSWLKYSPFLWNWFVGILLILSLLCARYAFHQISKHRPVSLIYGFGTLLTYIPFLYAYYLSPSLFFPNLLQQAIPYKIYSYTGTLLMPTLGHAFFVIVDCISKNRGKQTKSSKNFAVAISIPIAWYLFIQLILPFWKKINIDFSQHTGVVLTIISLVVFVVFLLRGFDILFRDKKELLLKHQRVWKILIAFIFPILGLALNKSLGGRSHSFLGDFDQIWIIALVIINGSFICCSTPDHKYLKLSLFMARSITFTFTSYFFLVLLPYLPYSIIAIAIFGAGILMLTPLALFTIHIKALYKDYQELLKEYPKQLLICCFVTGVLVLPAILTTVFISHKQILYEVISYIETPDYSKSCQIDRSSVQNVLESLETHKTGENEVGEDKLFSIKGIPYISTYYNWLVLNNMTLSSDKLNTIKNVFLGYKPDKWRNRDMGPEGDNVAISNLKTRSYFNQEKDAWISWIDLELTNQEEFTGFAEYKTVLELPNGCWISDYYLYVGEKKEMGMLTEKKAAIWVYNQIRDRNRDPGLLHYISGNRVAFQVFPFSKGEVRKTGIQFIHKEPIALKIDDREIRLGDRQHIHSFPRFSSQQGDTIYISSMEKERLPTVQRKPYYHFIFDVSHGKQLHTEKYVQQVNSLLKQGCISAKDSKVSFTNAYTRTEQFDKKWPEILKKQKFIGGFYLERAIKEILFQSYLQKTMRYPVIVVVTDHMDTAIIEKDFSDFKMTFPESDLFYSINDNGKLVPHSLVRDPKKAVESYFIPKFDNEVLVWPSLSDPQAYLRKNLEPEVILNQATPKAVNPKHLSGDWNSAIQLHGGWLSYTLYPGKLTDNWKNLVKGSFASRIMTPVTAYMVVETEAQREMLKQRQKDVLATHQAFTPPDNRRQMSEPGLIILLILSASFLGVKKRKVFIDRLKLKF